MIVENVIVADYAAESGGKVHILGAGITRLTLPALPVVLPTMAVLVRMHPSLPTLNETTSSRSPCASRTGR